MYDINSYLLGLDVTIAKEFKFCEKRKWRVDFAVFYKNVKIAVEVEGGVWRYGRHNRARGFLRDMEKYNTLAMEGWLLLRYTPATLYKVREDIQKIIKNAEGCRCSDE